MPLASTLDQRLEEAQGRYVQLCNSLLPYEDRSKTILEELLSISGYRLAKGTLDKSFVLTGPNHRELVRNVYGVESFPFTIGVDYTSWKAYVLSDRFVGGKRQSQRRRYRPLSRVLNAPTGRHIKLTTGDQVFDIGFFIDPNSLGVGPKRKNPVVLHEDMHAVFELYRGVAFFNEDVEGRLLSEIHSYHTDLDLGYLNQFSPNFERDIVGSLPIIAPEVSKTQYEHYLTKIRRAVETLLFLHNRYTEPDIEKLLLSSKSLDEFSVSHDDLDIRHLTDPPIIGNNSGKYAVLDRDRQHIILNWAQYSGRIGNTEVPLHVVN